ncbi:MAG: TIM barrel protein [Roseiflexaceae bacterium]
MAQARALLDTCASPALAVVLDVANLLTPATLAQQHAIVDEALAQLADAIVLVHAKETPAPPHTGECALGQGVVDFAYLAAALHRHTNRGAIIMHGVAEAATPRGLEYLRGIFSR